VADSRWALRISDDHRSVIRSDGTPWFWLGDTAWDLFARLSRDECTQYFANRSGKGFTVIQAVLAMGIHEFNAPNAYGDRPFRAGTTDPDLRNESNYWTHVDFMLDAAQKEGLYLGLLPLWGYDFVAGKQGAPVMFDRERGTDYARFLAERYGKTPNVVWINGGDVAGDENGPGDTETWNAIGKTIRSVDPEHLITYHPAGRHSSSECFADEPWLDFNMIQSGHKRLGFRNDEMIDRDYERSPVKPVLDAEPCYESHPVAHRTTNGFFNEYDARRAAYLSLFSGSFGHTYGHVNMWRFTVAGTRLRTQRFDMLDLDWQRVMEFPGAIQMTYVRNLMFSRPQTGRIPAQHLLAANVDGDGLQRATLGDGFAFVYAPEGDDISIDGSGLTWGDCVCSWYDPRTGTSRPATPAGSVQAGGGTIGFSPPGQPYRGNDWVLVVDDATRGFAAPGEVS